VRVIGLQAPLSFLNAYAFQAQLESVGAQVRLVVIEAGSLVEVDYTAAKTLADAIVALRAKGVNVAVARLESLQAQQAFREKKLADLLGPGRLFITVEEAVRALAPHSLSVD
jgi:MFS superfamily sulfate permease-like transporter